MLNPVLALDCSKFEQGGLGAWSTRVRELTNIITPHTYKLFRFPHDGIQHAVLCRPLGFIGIGQESIII